MHTGVSTASMFLRSDNEETLPLFDRLGIGCCEVFFTSFYEYSQKFGEFLAGKKGNVRVHSMHVLGTQFEPQLFNGNARVRADAYEWLERALAAGRAVGAGFYTFHGIPRMKRGMRSGENDPLAAWGKGLKQIDEVCARYGIKLCLENVEWAMYNRPGFFRAMTEEHLSLMGVFDIKQARLSGYPYPMYIKEMAGRIAHVHLSDIDENGRMCLPGRGRFDFAELLKRLNDAGFDGALIVEVYKDNFKTPEELKQSCDYLDELLYKYALKTQ